MIAVPFVYFSLLLIYIILKKGYDLSAYLVTIYVIISFFGILMDEFELREYGSKYYTLTLEPTIIYCALLTLTFLPFIKIDFKKIKVIKLTNLKLFRSIGHIFFLNLLLLISISLNSLINVWNGDLHEMRTMVYEGENVNTYSIGGPVVIIVNLLSNFSIIMLLFYFYSISFLNQSKLFNISLILGSFSIIIIGIMALDRSKTFYWLLTYGGMIVLFWKFLNYKQKKNIKYLSFGLISLILFYFISMTISRFGERDIGTQGGIIAYAGQSYVNFCMFYDAVDYSEFSLQRIFPLLYKIFVNNNIDSSVELNMDIENKTGYFVGVFSTFIGDIMVSSGKIVLFIFSITYSFICFSLFKKIGSVIYFEKIILLFCFILYPLLGLFVHFYASYMRTGGLVLLIIYAIYLRVNRHKGNYKYQN